MGDIGFGGSGSGNSIERREGPMGSGEHNMDHESTQKRQKKRMNAANKVQNANIIIISGHSLWFRSFFKAYLPRESNFEGKINKIANGGIVACQVTQYEFPDGSLKHCIHQNTILAIHKGFEMPKKKKIF